MSRIELAQIPAARRYDGYVWMSGATAPLVLEGDALPGCFDEGRNPFVAEAMLWDSEARLSYSVRHVGNETLCFRYEVADADFANGEVEEVVYASHRMDDRCLCFLEYWEPSRDDDDDFPKGMQPLEMTKRVFVGFKQYGAND